MKNDLNNQWKSPFVCLVTYFALGAMPGCIQGFLFPALRSGIIPGSTQGTVCGARDQPAMHMPYNLLSYLSDSLGLALFTRVSFKTVS